MYAPNGYERKYTCNLAQITGQFNFLCSVESSEIDLSEFQDENREDGVGNTENGTGQGENQPTGAPTESVSGNAGM